MPRRVRLSMSLPNNSRTMPRALRLVRNGLLIIIVFVAGWIANTVRSKYQMNLRHDAQAAEGSSAQRYFHSSQVGISLSVVHDVVLWTRRTGEIPIYRIPVLTYTPRGHLVAIVEGRKEAPRDASSKVFAVKRSTDGGETWSSSEQWIVDDGKPPKDVCSNLGTVIVDDTTATIFLMYVYCGFCPSASLMLMNSTNDGITWGRPRNITDIVGKNYVTHPSPGHGIQKKLNPAKGRLIVCGHGFHDGHGLVLLLSDDHGVTWRHGAFVPSVPFQNSTEGDFDPDECQPVELPDGSIYLVVRNQLRYRYNCKMIMRSFDGGETLPQNYTYLDQALIEPKITSGVWYHNGTMFYSGPNSKTERRSLHIRWSEDHGRTWTPGTEIWGDLAGYSTLTMLPRDREHLYIMYERGTRKYYDEIAFSKIEYIHREES
ncbi:NEU1 [Branchiostoma lanceolatum]|uniref:Sialidase-1 n=1 Tax=Branchiostoma lanceolatum TaxID=7740 RepID=A0A8K0EZA7_BRALA|nr:NEU1 [Branchiostoma lanceolatum]